MSIQSEITRLETAKSAIAAAIAGKGVTVPDGTMLDGMAALIEAIQAGGTISGDYMGYQVVSGVITFSENVTTSYKIQFPEGNRLRVKTTTGYVNRPFFILVPESSGSSVQGNIQLISAPTYGYGSNKPTVYAFINAYATDSSSFNSTYMKFVSLSWGVTPDSVNASSGSDRTFTEVTIPCTSNIRFMSGKTYRYVVGAPWGYKIDKVEVV